MSEEQISAKPKQRRRWLRVLFVILLVLSSFFTGWRLILRHQLNKRLDTIRAEGYPVTFKEIHDWHQKSSDTEDAAPIYLNAFACLVEKENFWSLPKIDEGKTITYSAPLSADEKTTLSSVLADNQNALALLHEAAGKKSCRFPLNFSMGFSMPMKHLSGVRRSALLLQMEGIWFAENGDTEKAVRTVLDSIALAQSLKNEPLVISQIVRFTMIQITISTCERIINRAFLSDEQLGALSQAFAELDDSHPLVIGLVGERCLSQCTMADTRQILSGMAMTTAPASPPWWWSPVLFLHDFSGLKDFDRISHLDFAGEFIKVAQMPFPEKITVNKDIEVRLENVAPVKLMTRMLVPVLLGTTKKSGRSFASIRVLESQLAVERFRLAKGRLPETLEEIAPTYIATIPTDPFDGKPLRFKKLPNGYAIYSIGDDCKDNDGSEKSSDGYRWGNGTDIIFSVER